MHFITTKILLLTLLILGTGIVFLGVKQFLFVQKAHNSFENYYAFRGCVQLLTKTDTFATCKLSSSRTIKLVEVNGKWYLDNDLPVCVGKFCW